MYRTHNIYNIRSLIASEKHGYSHDTGTEADKGLTNEQYLGINRGLLADRSLGSTGDLALENYLSLSDAPSGSAGPDSSSVQTVTGDMQQLMGEVSTAISQRLKETYMHTNIPIHTCIHRHIHT